MRIDQMIRDLQKQKRELERVIALLEEFENDRLERRSYKAPESGIPMPTQRRRGRKFMTASERLAVSERMKQYWSGRRTKESDAALSQLAEANDPKRRESLQGTRR